MGEGREQKKTPGAEWGLGTGSWRGQSTRTSWEADGELEKRGGPGKATEAPLGTCYGLWNCVPQKRYAESNAI